MSLLVLIDYENVPSFDLSALPKTALVLIVLGKKQTMLPVALIQATQKLGDRLEWCPVDTSGDNAADFVLAFELGKRLAASPSSQVAILSHDKGFDALAHHITEGKRVCRRVDSLSELTPKPKPPPEPDPLTNYIASLQKAAKARPASRGALEKHVASHFRDKSASECAALVQTLFTRKIVAEVESCGLVYPKWPVS